MIVELFCEQYDSFNGEYEWSLIIRIREVQRGMQGVYILNVMTDSGCYRLEEDGFKLLMSIKKKKNCRLDDIEKKYNKMIGEIRVAIEHINRQLKTFRILGERYRNRQKRLGLRINLIAALVNRINLQQ